MTSKQVEEQIAAIREVTAKAMVSKEAAAAFLISARIIKEHDHSFNSISDLIEEDSRNNIPAKIKSRNSHGKKTHRVQSST